MPKIMIVDDDRTMVGLLQTLLEMEGYGVTVASRVATALPIARAEKPDVVLIDVHLADGDGLDLLRQLRADPDLARARVVMSSGLDMLEESQQAGSDGFILKPYSPDQLVTILKNALEN